MYVSLLVFEMALLTLFMGVGLELPVMSSYSDKVDYIKESALAVTQIWSQLIIHDIHNKRRIFEIETST